MSAAAESLPSGWARASLEAVIDHDIEQISPQAGSFVYIDIGSVDNLSKRIAKPKTVSSGKAPSRARQKVRTGDVLVSTVRPNLNAVARVSSDLDGAIASTGFVVLRPKQGVLSDWLLLVVRSKRFVSEMSQLVRGALYPAVRASQIRAFSIPVPPTQEQLRIIQKLQSLEKQSQQAQAHLDSVPLQLAESRRSILAEHCVKPTAEQARATGFVEWPRIQLREIVTELKQGWSPRCVNSPALPGKWGVIKTTAVQPMLFNDSENKALPSHFNADPELEIRKGDVLITRKGPRGRAGITAFVQQTREKLMVCDTVYRLRVDPSKCEPRFLAYLLNVPAVMEEIDKIKTGLSESGMGFTQSQFLSLTVCLPPINEQRKIVHRLDAALTRIDAAAAAHRIALAEIDRVNQSIVDRALAGDLVEQDPSEEAAERLLTSLAAEEASKTSEPKKRMPPKAKLSINREPSSLLDMLVAANRSMSPEDLFYQTGRDETDLDQVEQFYSDLRQLVREGKVREVRPNSGVVLLSAML
jgi:type I restriction enzyme S subunit